MSRDPVPLSDSVTGVVKSLRGPGGKAVSSSAVNSMGGLFGRWDEMVGSAVAAHVQPVKLDGNRLVVEVDDPAWATQLRFLEADLRTRLEATVGAVIESFDIRVKRR